MSCEDGEDGRPYRIVGERQAWGGFQGRHEGLTDDAEVVANWGPVADRLLGSWTEEGHEYVFSVVLPAAASGDSQ